MSTYSAILLQMYRRNNRSIRNDQVVCKPHDGLFFATGYYDSMLFNKIECLSDAVRSNDGLTINVLNKRHTLHQVVALLKGQAISEDKYNEIMFCDSPMRCLTFLAMDSDGAHTLADSINKTESEMKTLFNWLSNQSSIYPLDIHVFATTSLNKLAVLFNAMPADKAPAGCKTFTDTTLLLLAHLSAHAVAVNIQSKVFIKQIRDTYSCFLFNPRETNGKTNITMPDPLAITADVRVHALAGYPVNPFINALTAEISTLYPSWDKYLNPVLFPGTNDFSVHLNSIPFDVFLRLYGYNGFLTAIGELYRSANKKDKTAHAYVLDFYTVINGTANNIADGIITPNTAVPVESENIRLLDKRLGKILDELECLINRYPNTFHKQAYHYMYCTLEEMTVGYTRGASHLCESWILDMYGNLLCCFLQEIFANCVIRLAQDDQPPTINVFRNNFDLMLANIHHVHAYATNTSSYTLLHYSFLPRVLVGYTALVNSISADVFEKERAADQSQLIQFLCSTTYDKYGSTEQPVNEIERCVYYSSAPERSCYTITYHQDQLYRFTEMIESSLHEIGHEFFPRGQSRKYRLACAEELVLSQLINTICGAYVSEDGGNTLLPLSLLLQQNFGYSSNDSSIEDGNMLLLGLQAAKERIWNYYQSCVTIAIERLSGSLLLSKSQRCLADYEDIYKAHDRIFSPDRPCTDITRRGLSDGLYSLLTDFDKEVVPEVRDWLWRYILSFNDNVPLAARDALDDLMDKLSENAAAFTAMEFQNCANDQTCCQTSLLILLDVASDIYMIEALNAMDNSGRMQNMGVEDYIDFLFRVVPELIQIKQFVENNQEAKAREQFMYAFYVWPRCRLRLHAVLSAVYADELVKTLKSFPSKIGDWLSEWYNATFEERQNYDRYRMLNPYESTLRYAKIVRDAMRKPETSPILDAKGNVFESVKQAQILYGLAREFDEASDDQKSVKEYNYLRALLELRTESPL
ncbi:hypothetical protein AGMMS49992_18690 [Clostridia bacterium]|nr:hypothetical protein AGMMS49992_18690 [Clostridia bacterium]